MRAVDTSVAVPLLMTTHPDHAFVEEWARERQLALGPRAALETYAVLTRLPGTNRLRAHDAVTVIEANFDLGVQQPVATQEVAPRLAGAGVSGGASYDAVVALEAADAGLPLVSRDARARSTYARVGADVELLGPP